jgi:hypothetical protein
MNDLISFDFTLDNILSVKAPRGTDPDKLLNQVRGKLCEVINDECEVFMFEGTFEEQGDE